MENLETIKKWIEESNNIVFFGGAGVSTESGIPDFRGEKGIYQKTYTLNGRELSAEELLEINFAQRNQELFYDYYVHDFIHPNATPNDAHKALTELEKMGKLKAIITQNVDSLHQKANSKNVLELHGTTSTYRCDRCFKEYSSEEVMNQLKTNKSVKCDKCNGFVRPNIVFYGEALPSGVFEKAIEYITNADVFIVAGTSLNVYPAANLMNYYHGNKCILINLQKTPYDSMANCVIHEKVGKVLKEVVESIE